ncbi:hypothetical protein OHA72_48605 [Dactylosporangium sp. NBC_01737]|uniref:hypothetical protein n=1 Tax=Dactylosporangium sp. NBC_01737 TaxID=2975959 RepID=UPI002E15D9E4|nr:hypothetical protein OHA72_48605 [Dactylosporangium sp. NBC_01737]
MHRRDAKSARLCLIYRQGAGTLQTALTEATRRGFALTELSFAAAGPQEEIVSATVRIEGIASIDDLAIAIARLDGIVNVESDPITSHAEDKPEPRSYL